MRLESRRENSDPGESQEIASRFRALASNGCVPRLSAQPQTNATLRAFSGPIGRTQIFGFTVEQTAAGQTDGIEKLVLGTEVFDRPPDFKPQVDTIVRVAVGAWGVWRLRTPVAP